MTGGALPEVGVLPEGGTQTDLWYDWADCSGPRADSSSAVFDHLPEMDFARYAADQVCFPDNAVVLERGGAEQVLTDPQEAAIRRFLTRLLNR